MASPAGRKLVLGLLFAGIALVSLAAIVAQRSAPLPTGDGPHWRRIAWQLPRDAWPAGRAYRCSAAWCSEALEVHVRPKVGFCNCLTGVADDAEVDRVADLDLLSEQFSPLGEGVVIDIAGLKGRARDYQVRRSHGAVSRARGIALSRECDLIVAVVDGNVSSQQAERALHHLLTDAVTGWVGDVLEGRGR